MSNTVVTLPEARVEQGVNGEPTKLTGCKLVYRKGPDDELGDEWRVVVAGSSIPMWLSKDYPEMVVKEKQDSKFRIQDYSIEWFEKILFINSGRHQRRTMGIANDAAQYSFRSSTEYGLCACDPK